MRILICRYRPRVLPKSEETWDLWWKDLGPSVDLHAAFYGKKGQTPLGWDEYRLGTPRRNRGEEERIAILAEQVAAGKTITLLCSSACEDETHCHRTLLRHLIERGWRKGPPRGE